MSLITASLDDAVFDYEMGAVPPPMSSGVYLTSSPKLTQTSEVTPATGGWMLSMFF